jgi:signal transduction histidine kinase
MAPRHTLLVVDDEPDVVQSLQDLLRREYHVLGATHARDGLRLVQQQPVHLVMTDQRMPEISGVEFLRRVRHDQPDAVRLLFTGYADIKAVIDAINEGHVYRYITKPWDPDELIATLRQAGEQYDLLQERRQLLDTLRRQNQELEKANALKEAFIRVASHELRTPLTILLALPELALHNPSVNPLSADCFRRIRQSGQRLHRLVEELLHMLQAGSFDRPLRRRPAALADLVNEAVEDVRPFLEKRRQRLKRELAANLGMLDVDREKIRICLDHLLSNAIKFTPDGGTIEVIGQRADKEVTLQVRDNGVGIEAANLPHIFEPFFTELDVSQHASGQFEFGRRGLGLGLSVVRAFIGLHDGTVHVSSSPGQGTTFTLTLPAPAPSPSAGRGPENAEPVAEPLKSV